MEGSKSCHNDRTSCVVILPPFEYVYILNCPSNLRHKKFLKPKNFDCDLLGGIYWLSNVSRPRSSPRP